MRKRMVSAALALCLALTLFSGTALAAGQHPFTDVPQGHWAGDAVQYVYENNLMGGTDSTTFSPNNTTTRGMIVTVLYRLTGEPASGTASQFTDVAAGAWYAKAVAWAASRDIVNGTSATTFSPNSPITREQLAVIFYRYAQDQGWDVSAWTDLGLYQDAAQVSDYATQALAWAVGAGLITGTTDTTLSPRGPGGGDPHPVLRDGDARWPGEPPGDGAKPPEFLPAEKGYPGGHGPGPAGRRVCPRLCGRAFGQHHRGGGLWPL